MNFNCVICTEHLTDTEEVSYTKCGHVFHYVCISQWIQMSKTCPQCRVKVTPNRIRKLYLNMSSETLSEKEEQLHELIASLRFQVFSKEKAANHFMSKTQLLEKQNMDLGREVLRLEIERNEKNAAICALKEQLAGYETTKQEIIQSKKKIDELKIAQKLLDTPIEDINSLVGETRDPSTLLKYITVMKAENLTFLTEIKNLKTNLKNVLKENAKLSQTYDKFPRCYSKSRVLGKLIRYKNERLILQTRIDELEKALGIAASPNRISSPLSDSVKLLDDRLQRWFAKEEPRNLINRKRKENISTVTSQDIEQQQTASRSNIERNDAPTSSFNKMLDIPTTSKRPKLLTTQEETNDRKEVHVDNGSESVLRKCQHTITSSSTSEASTVPQRRNLRSRTKKPSKRTRQKAEDMYLIL